MKIMNWIIWLASQVVCVAKIVSSTRLAAKLFTLLPLVIWENVLVENALTGTIIQALEKCQGGSG